MNRNNGEGIIIALKSVARSAPSEVMCIVRSVGQSVLYIFRVTNKSL